MSFESASNYNTYCKYLELKKKLSFGYKGVDLAIVCAIDLIEVLIDNRKITIRKLLEILFKRVNIKKIKGAFLHSDYIFTSDVPGRKDHEQLVMNIKQNIPNSSYIKLEHYFIPIFNPLFFLKFLKAIRKEKDLRLISKMQQLYLAAKFTYHKRLIDSLDTSFRNISLKNKGYIPLNSSAYSENALTMFFNNKDVNTYHIFHGFFGNYKTRIANDVVNGDNITAKHILAMSESQKMELVRDFSLKEEDIVVAGHPKYTGLPEKPKLTFKKCLILNGISAYDQSFLPLLSILEELSDKNGIDFSIKPHPLSKINQLYDFSKSKIKIIDKSCGIKDLMSSGEYDFTITHNTSSYYESMYYGLIALRWDNGTNMQFAGINDKFTNKEELLAKIDSFKNHTSNPEVIQEEIKKILEYNIGIGINNYAKEIIK